jgi:hypothetical protein
MSTPLLRAENNRQAMAMPLSVKQKKLTMKKGANIML